MKRLKALCAIVVLIEIGLVNRIALAGAPFLTDDPEPVEKGHGEFFIASQSVLTHDDFFATLPHFELNYGPIENVQLHALTPFVYDRPQDSSSQYGYGDTELGVKWRFLREDQLFKGSPEAGTYPLLEVDTGNASRGLGNGRDQLFVPLWLQESWGEENRQWTLYGGGGYWFNPGDGNENFGFFGAVLQKQITDRLMIGGELNHSTVSAEGESPHTAFNLGFVYDFSDHWHLCFSAGGDIKGDNRLNSYVALQYTW